MARIAKVTPHAVEQIEKPDGIFDPGDLTKVADVLNFPEEGIPFDSGDPEADDPEGSGDSERQDERWLSDLEQSPGRLAE